MSKLVLEANVKLKGEVLDVDKDLYNQIVAEYKTEKELENRAKKDFIRAIIEDLGFEAKNVKVTKFKYRLVEEEEV